MKKVYKIIVNIIFFLILILGLFVAVSALPNKNIYKLYSVMSGSMEPTIKVGSVVFVKPADEYKVGDVITFGINESSEKVTHRINKIVKQDNNQLVQTKGDANNAADTDLIQADQIVGKEYFSIPWLGYVLNYIKTPVGLVLVIIIPSVIIVYEEIRKIKNETKEIIKKRRARREEASRNKKRVEKNEKDS